MRIGPRPDGKSCASGACLNLNSQIGKHTPDKRSYGIFDLGSSLQTFPMPIILSPIFREENILE